MLSYPIADDLYYEFALTNPDGTAYTGKTDVTVDLSLTDGGPIVTGMTTTPATEKVATPGIYSVTLSSASALTNIGTARIGQPGFIVIRQGAKVHGSDPVVFVAAPRTLVP